MSYRIEIKTHRITAAQYVNNPSLFFDLKYPNGYEIIEQEGNYFKLQIQSEGYFSGQ